MNPHTPPIQPATAPAQTTASYRPPLPARRSEVLSWTGSAALAASAAFSIFRTGSLSWVHGLFLGIVLLVSASLSLANRLDRLTVITLSADGLDYSSPLRSCSMRWQDIGVVRILQYDHGIRVFIQSGREHFTYRTTVPGITRPTARTAGNIVDGELLTAAILASASFAAPHWQDGYWEYRSPGSPQNAS